jgi:gamma-glutamylcyclotransferase (GGCT)/AIG2-like uncharacterized protein YtfP
MLLFVYGTLKSGFGANDLLQPAKLVAQEVALRGFNMYSNGAYPMVVESPYPKDTVYGEIWEIHEDALRRLDSYEGHPHLFVRGWLSSDQIEFSSDHGVMMYYYNRPTSGFHVESGRFEPHHIGGY